MLTIGNLQPFDPSKDDIEIWIRVFKSFLLANDMELNKPVDSTDSAHVRAYNKSRAILLVSIGFDAVTALTKLLSPRLPEDSDLKELLAILSAYYKSPQKEETCAKSDATTQNNTSHDVSTEFSVQSRPPFVKAVIQHEEVEINNNEYKIDYNTGLDGTLVNNELNEVDRSMTHKPCNRSIISCTDEQSTTKEDGEQFISIPEVMPAKNRKEVTEENNLDEATTTTTSIIVNLFTTGQLQGNLSSILQQILSMKTDWENQEKGSVHPAFTKIQEFYEACDYKNLQSYITELTDRSKDKLDTRNIVCIFTENNICQKFCSKTVASRLLKKHLLDEEMLCEPNELPLIHQKILNLYQSRQFEDLIALIQNKVDSLCEAKNSKYDKKVKRIFDKIRELTEQGHFDKTDTEEGFKRGEIFLSLTGYFGKKEELWRISSKDSLELWKLPEEHRNVLQYIKEDDEQAIISYICKVIKESFETDSIAYVNEKVQLAVPQQSGDGANKVVASLGSTLTVGLSTLHVLVPATSAFKSLIDQLNLFLLTPALSSTGVLAGVSGAVVAGICIVNAYKAYKGTISTTEAAKRTIDSVVPFAIASGVGFLLAASLASVAPPIFVSVAAFAGAGFLAHWVATVGVSKFTQWLFYGLPKKRALKKAYEVLEIKDTVTDEELRKTYKYRLLKCHPDKHAANKYTEEQIEDARREYFEIQEAFKLILSHRLEQESMKNEDGGLLSRIKRFFTRSDKTDDTPKPILPLEYHFESTKIA